MREQLSEIHSAAAINERVGALASEITDAFGQRELTALGVLEDSFVFLADLLRALRAPHLRTAFLRYDHRSLGGVQDLSFSTQIDVTGRDILLVEGVLDTGVTQEYLIKQLESRGAASVRLCVLVDKPDRRRTAVQPDWRAFETHEDYVFGYGLAFQERWRELPYLATFARAQS
jgi:hypoxanthine phosphoribosyltransferase